MNSEELNAGIRLLCDDETIYATIGNTGKTLPYIGWYWRDVDFDSDGYRFGVIPGQFKGFMESNKWGYGYTHKTTPEEWATIKRHLSEAVTAHLESRVSDAQRALAEAYKAIQAIPEGET